MERIKTKLLMLLTAITLCLSLTVSPTTPVTKAYASSTSQNNDVFNSEYNNSTVNFSGSITVKTIFTYVLRIIFGFVAIAGLLTFAKSLPDAVDALQNNQDPTAMKKAAFQLISPIVMIFLEIFIDPIMDAIF